MGTNPDVVNAATMEMEASRAKLNQSPSKSGSSIGINLYDKSVMALLVFRLSRLMLDELCLDHRVLSLRCTGVYFCYRFDFHFSKNGQDAADASRQGTMFL